MPGLKNDDTNILVDGHNRLKICQKHGLPYKVKKAHSADIEEVKERMVDNQLAEEI